MIAASNAAAYQEQQRQERLRLEAEAKKIAKATKAAKKKQN